MLTAIRNSDKQKVIGALIQKEKGQTYYCPGCGEEMRHYKSSNGPQIGHFKHLPNSRCYYNNKGQSLLHLNTILQIYTYLKNNFKSIEILEVEQTLCSGRARADIFIQTKKRNKIAIEVQVSTLTIDEIIRRTENYTRAGIFVLWVLPYQKERFKRKEGILRLKEYELFLTIANKNKLIFWEEKYSPLHGFLVLSLIDEYSPERVTEVGKEVYYTSPKLKSHHKSWDQKNIDYASFSMLYPKRLKEIKKTGRPYIIPERIVLFPE